MKIIRQEESCRMENSPSCTAIEYPLGDRDINAAVIMLDGRYPETGYAYNEVCKELFFLLDGNGRLVTRDGEHTFKKGDQILIDPGETYFWEGTLKMLISSSPAWFPEQHKNAAGHM